MFQPNQSLAVVWNVGRKKRWYIKFYLGDNGDGTFRGDHLTRVGTGDKTWQRPPGSDDIQDTIEEQIALVTVLGIWDYSQTKPFFF